MITIRREQMLAMARPLWEKFQGNLLESVQRRFPDRARELGPEGLKRLFDRGLEKADEYRLESDADTALAVELCIQYGPDFDRGADVKDLTEYLADADISGGEKMRTLQDRLQAPGGSAADSR